MDCISTRLPYRQTNAFTDITCDYLDQSAALKPFYTHPPTLQGIQKAIDERKKINTDRKVLVDALTRQYEAVSTLSAVKQNIESLLSPSTFTITTAHQPNLFTGPLYFIYKILHVIRLAEHCNASFSGHRFVPVYYMGSEDADLDELGNFSINGEKYSWQTKQTGAVGRMKVDKELVKLIQSIEGQLAVLPDGQEILSLVREYYKEGVQIQDATFRLVDKLFNQYGLIVLIPDSGLLKKGMIKIFEDDLINQTAPGIVQQSITKLQSAGYSAQANPREINLFYLSDGVRNRIEVSNGNYSVVNTKLSFTKEQMLAELNEHPERFSPNVILRGIYQEHILPNIAFVGGGGELAYWLQYKELFAHYKIPFPVLVLRNSFLMVEKKWQEKIAKLGLSIEDFFQPAEALLNKIVERDTKNKVRLNGAFEANEQFYEQLKKQSSAIDATLAQHIEALKARAVHRLHELEKKMLRAEKRKFSDQQRQIQAIREKLFPNNGLQERVDNFMPYYAKWGRGFIESIYKNSLSLEHEFVVLHES